MLCFKLLMIICEQALTLHWIYHYLYVVSNLYEFSSSMEHKEIYSTRQNVYTKEHQSPLTFIASLLYTMKVNGDWVLLLYSLEKRKTNLWLWLCVRGKRDRKYLLQCQRSRPLWSCWYSSSSCVFCGWHGATGVGPFLDWWCWIY